MADNGFGFGFNKAGTDTKPDLPKPAGAPGSFGGTSPGGPGGINRPSEATGKLVNAAKQYADVELLPTVASDDNAVMTIIAYGPKDVGKSCGPAGIKRRLGGRKVIISCDDTTEETLRNYYGPEFYKDIELYEPTRRRIRMLKGPDGQVVLGPDGKPQIEELYPGYDPDRPWTAELVISKIAALLDKLEKDKNVEICMVDHFQALYEKIAVTYARFKAGRAPEQRLQLEDWQWRTESMDYMESKIRRVPMPGGIAIITGYGPEIKTTYGAPVKMPNGNEKRPVVRVMTDPKWLKDDIKRNWHVIVEASFQRVQDANNVGTQKSADQYFVEVINSKTPRFPKGAKVDITGKSLDVFWSERHLLPKDEAPIPVHSPVAVVA